MLSFLVFLAFSLYLATLVCFITNKGSSVVMSVITLAFFNFLAVAIPFFILGAPAQRTLAPGMLGFGYFDAWGGWGFGAEEVAYMAYLFVILLIPALVFGSIGNASYHTKVEDRRAKALWMKINYEPTERDNSLFKVGCAISAIVLGASLFMPMFSINVSLGFVELSERFTIIGLITVLDELPLPSAAIEFAIIPVLIGAILILFYAIVLFFISFSNSKLMKTVMGLQLAISIVICVFVARAALNHALSELERSLVTGLPIIDGLGIPQLIFGSIGGIFGSLFRLEYGVWMLLGSLAAYILFASCHFSRIKMPGFVPVRQQVVKIRCLSCGNLIDEVDLFCNICGQPVRNPVPSPAPVPHVRPPQQQAEWTNYEDERDIEVMDEYEESYEGQDMRMHRPDPYQDQDMTVHPSYPYQGQERRRPNPEPYQGQERRRPNPEPYQGQERRRAIPATYQAQERRRQNPEPYHEQEMRRRNPDPYQEQEMRRRNPEPYQAQERKRRNPDPYQAQEARRQNYDSYQGQERRRPNPEPYQGQERRRINPLLRACAKCGSKFVEGLRFCNVCGASRRKRAVET